MKYRVPGYYRTFQCIADKCRDNCCIGWEIDIDEDTLGYYSEVSGEFGSRLEKNISDGSFVLTAEERCPFLNKRGLCDMFTELGEEHLCQICTDHPRYYEWFGDVKEGGIGLCCEESARIILSNDHYTEEYEIQEEEGEYPDGELYELLFKAREEIIYHLQNEYLDIAVCMMLDYAEKLQVNIDNGEYVLPEWKAETAGENPDIVLVLEYMTGLEPIDSKWIPYIKRCIAGAEKVPLRLSEHEIYLRRIAVYFIYRYFMKGVFDGEIISRVKLSAVSTLVIGYLWSCEKYNKGVCSFEECAWIAKNYSKEIEYSEENLEALADAFYEEPYFSSSALKGMFSC